MVQKIKGYLQAHEKQYELLRYLIAGGLFYSVGVIFYACKKLPHYHAIWHLFVLAGSVCFYAGIYGKLLLFPL